MNARIPADPGRSRPNRALLGWVWRRNMNSSGIAVGCAIILLISAKNMLLPTAIFFVSLSGLFVVGHLRAAPFLLARPVTRRQVYNASLLAGLEPWLLLAVLPAAIYALLASRVPDRYYLGPPAFVSLGLVVWPLALYLCSACIGVAFTGTVKTTRNPISGGLALMWALVISMWVGIIGWAAILAFHFQTRTIPATGPALITTGLALSVIFYQAGWRLFRNLDL